MTNFGCSQCFGEDADLAWTASRTVRLDALVEESHFSLRLTACACGQRFLTVFTERIDWRGGEDDQTWLSVPVSEPECEQLEQASEDARPALLSALASGRRFITRSFPTGGSLNTTWQTSGFFIGPHD